MGSLEKKLWVNLGIQGGFLEIIADLSLGGVTQSVKKEEETSKQGRQHEQKT